MPKVTKKASPLLDEDKGAEKIVDTSSQADDVGEKTSETKVAAKPDENKISKEMRSDAEHARIALGKEEKVHFMIPLVHGEKAGAFEQMWTNGFYTKIPKGVMSIIPKSLAERLAEKYKVEAEAGAEFRLDLNEDKADNLG